jgi:hypothetical protein
MSTTPSIFKRPRASYTVVGGGRDAGLAPDSSRRDGLTVLLLARGGRFYREEQLRELSGLPGVQVLSVEGPGPTYDLEELARRDPAVRFLLLREPASPGEKINLGMGEALSERVLVLWSDLRDEGGSLAAGLEPLRRELLCHVPRLKSPRGEVLPSMLVPAMIKGSLKVMPWKPSQEGMRSLYPFDYCGLYSRRRFLQLGGYDPWMGNPYWQKMDFGFRAGLWGETIAWNPRLQFAYSGEPEGEDSTPDSSYKLFFLKNMAVRFTGDSGLLPLSRLPRYALRSGSGLLDSLKEFREVRAWVHENRFRFQGDAPSLLGRWEMPE